MFLFSFSSAQFNSTAGNFVHIVLSPHVAKVIALASRKKTQLHAIANFFAHCVCFSVTPPIALLRPGTTIRHLQLFLHHYHRPLLSLLYYICAFCMTTVLSALSCLHSTAVKHPCYDPLTGVKTQCVIISFSLAVAS